MLTGGAGGGGGSSEITPTPLASNASIGADATGMPTVVFTFTPATGGGGGGGGTGGGGGGGGTGGGGGGGASAATVGSERISPTAFPAAPSGPSAFAGRKHVHGAVVTYIAGHKLSPGPYQLLVTPLVAGRPGRSATARFRIVK
jgi:hypothetical protein